MMRAIRLRFVTLFMLGGETGVAGAQGVAACKSLDVVGCATAPAGCEGGGVVGAMLVAAFCCCGAMSAKRDVNSWPSIGLRLNRDLVARY